MVSVPVSGADSTDEKPLLVVSWKAQADNQRLPAGEWLPASNGDPERLKLQQTNASGQTYQLVEISKPAIEHSTYAIVGRIRYQDVSQPGYLEMWNHFESGSYFTRTLAMAGPLRHISGTSAWREFALPFNKSREPAPQLLHVNLVLPSTGTVELTDLRLISPADQYLNPTVAGAWWSDRTGGLIGGVAGALLGVYIGCVLAPLTAKGRARTFTLSSFTLLGTCAVVCVIAGLIAMLGSQPYAVYYPLLLLGLMGIFFGFGGLLAALRQYRDHELRKMTALDVR